MVLAFLMSVQVFAAENIKSKAKVSPVALDIAKQIILDQRAKIRLKDMSTNKIEPDNGQNFKIDVLGKEFYVLSATRNSPQDYPPTCAILLFDESKKFINIVDAVGPNDDKRPWTCEGTEAMSFADYYQDGSLKIIALYLATAPSSERSIVPVVLKFDTKIPSLKIDEKLTSLFDDRDITTIKAARNLLKKHSKAK